MQNFRGPYHLYAFLTVFGWALGFVFTRICLRHFSPLSLGFLRYVVASLTLLGLSLAAKPPRPKPKDIPIFALAGACGFFLYMSFFNSGSAKLPAATNSLIIATAPVMTAILARIFYKEKLSFLKWAATAIELCGIGLLGALSGGLKATSGFGAMLAAAAMMAVYNIISRRLSKSYPPFAATAYAIYFGTALLAVYSPAAVRELRSAPALVLASLISMGVVSSAMAYASWSVALSKAPKASQVTNYMFLTPFLTALLGFLLAGEPLGAPALIGGGVILASFALFNFSAVPKQASS